jgi:1,2-diacylglycerol 3-alpha-glucosyltransferase
MKIVMLCDFFNEDLEYQENLLARYYHKRGHKVTVVCSLYDSIFDYYVDKPVSGSPRIYQTGNAKVIKLPYRYNILHRLRAYPKIDDILSEERPDLIYVHDIMLNLPECIVYVKQHPETRMIMDYHGDYTNSGRNWLSLRVLHGVIRKWFLDRARPHLEKIFPIVPASTEFLRDIYGVPEEEMELLPLGVDLEFARKVKESGAGAALRRTLGIPADAFVIFTGGKLHPYKKTEHLLEAFRTLDRADMHILLVGTAAAEDADYARMLTELADEHPRIHFRGWLNREQVYAHLDAADLAVFPASQSVLWQQAISMELPLILAETSELLRGRSEVGYMNEHGNIIVLDDQRPVPPQIVAHLNALIADPERRARMAEGARRTAEELLDWEVLIERTLRFNLGEVAARAQQKAQ